MIFNHDRLAETLASAWAPWPYLVLFCLMSGCNFPGRPDPADRPIPADQVLEFSALYGQNCAGCHGIDGKLGPAPPLNDPLFRAIVPEEVLQSILANGRKGTLMPAFVKQNGGTLTEAQVQVLVNEIKGVRYRIVKKPEGDLAKIEVVLDPGGTIPKWGSSEVSPKGAPAYRSQAKSSGGGDKEKGGAVFAKACAACHGDQGQGIQEKGEVVRMIHDPAFLALTSNQAIRRYVITGRTDLGMPSYSEAHPGSPKFEPLTDQDVTDLVALLASWRR